MTGPEVPGWEVVQGKLHREFQFADFRQAFAFMTAVALEAERLDHHPDWSNSWNRVVIDVVDHTAGEITARCCDLAGRINRYAPSP
ncbi:MAG TPA: 4a-hydroxytetrahydrobiopterin dehydratase [Acidimicrobiales bacterium]|nr:4a-hydroxytetrahydrobiopterin dehydratase [Acidimicrobiales bacterium]